MSDKYSIIDDIFFIDASTLPNGIAKVKIRATHSGYVNRNNVYYTDKLLEESYRSFVKPYPKPIVINHTDDQRDVIGRITNARFIKNPAPSANEPTGYVELDGYISDPESIQMLKDKRLLTVSIRGVATKSTKLTCSICKKELSPDEVYEHEHVKGQTYGKKKCYYVVDGALEYFHVAFVADPADVYATAEPIEDSFHDFHSDVITDIGEIEHIKIENKEIEDKIMTSENEIEDKVEEQQTVEQPQVTNNDCENKTESTNDVTGISTNEKTEENTCDCDNDDNNCDCIPDFSDLSKEELDELLALDLLMEQELGEDGKLSTKKRNSLPDRSFCGPNRSFPVPDCAHVTAALRLLGRAKVSESTKAKIRACVMRKAKNLGCSVSKDDYDRIIDYINDKFYPELKTYIKSVIDEAINNFKNDFNDKTAIGKYETLQKEANRLAEKLDSTVGEMHNNRLLALKAIKVLVSPLNVTLDSVSVTQDEIINFEETVHNILKDNIVNDDNVQNIESQVEEKNEDRNINIKKIDQMSFNEKLELISKLFNK